MCHFNEIAIAGTVRPCRRVFTNSAGGGRSPSSDVELILGGLTVNNGGLVVPRG